MDDPMPDPDQPMVGAVAAQERKEMVERPFVPERGAIAPGLLAENVSGRVLRNEPRRSVEPVRLAVNG